MSSKNLPNSDKIHHSTNHNIDRRDNETGFNNLEERPTTSIAGSKRKTTAARRYSNSPDTSLIIHHTPDGLSETESPDNNIQDTPEYLIISSDESVVCEKEIKNAIPKTKSKTKCKEKSRKSRESTPSLSSSDGKISSDDNTPPKNRNKKSASHKPRKTGDRVNDADDFATGSISRAKRKFNTSDPLTSEGTSSGRKIRKVDDTLPPGPRPRPTRSLSPRTLCSVAPTSDCASLSRRIENHLEQSSSKSRRSLARALLEKIQPSKPRKPNTGKTPTDKEVDESTTTSTTTTSDEDLDSPGSKKSTDIEGIAKCSDDVTNFASILLLKINEKLDQLKEKQKSKKKKKIEKSRHKIGTEKGSDEIVCLDETAEDSGQKPRESRQKPRESGDKPGESGDKPGESGQKTGESAQKPGESGQKPEESGQKPSELGQKPGGSGEKTEESSKSCSGASLIYTSYSLLQKKHVSEPIVEESSSLVSFKIMKSAATSKRSQQSPLNAHGTDGEKLCRSPKFKTYHRRTSRSRSSSRHSPRSSPASRKSTRPSPVPRESPRSSSAPHKSPRSSPAPRKSPSSSPAPRRSRKFSPALRKSRRTSAAKRKSSRPSPASRQNPKTDLRSRISSSGQRSRRSRSRSKSRRRPRSRSLIRRRSRSSPYRDRPRKNAEPSPKSRDQRQTCYSEWYSILNAPLQSNPTIQTQNPGNPSLLSNQVYPSPSFPDNQTVPPPNHLTVPPPSHLTVPPPNHLTVPPPSHLTLPPPSHQTIPPLSHQTIPPLSHQTIPPLSHQTVPHLSSILVQEPQSSWIQSEQICGSTVFPAQSSFSTSTLPILLQTDLSQSHLEAESFPTAYPEYSDVNPSLYDNQVMYPIKSLSTPIPESTLSETSLVDSFSQQRTKIRLNLVNSDLYGKTFPSEQDTLPVTERESTTPLLDENIPEKFQILGEDENGDENNIESEPVKENSSSTIVHKDSGNKAGDDQENKDVFEDLDYIPMYSNKVTIFFTSESMAKYIFKIITKIPSKTQIVENKTRLSYKIFVAKFAEAFYAFTAFEIIKHLNIENEAERIIWSHVDGDKSRVNKSGFNFWSIGLLTLDEYSATEGLQRIPLKISMTHKDEIFDGAVLPSHLDTHTLRQAGLEVEDFVAHHNGKIIIDSVNAKPISVIKNLVSSFSKRCKDNILVFKNWDEARVFQKLVEGCNMERKVEVYVSHIGVMENHRLGLNLACKMPDFLLDIADCLEEESKHIIEHIWSPKYTIDKTIKSQFILKEYINNVSREEDFLELNCLKIETRNMISILPVLPGHICFLNIRYMEVNGEYYLAAVDACLSNNFGTNHNLFLPVQIPGVDPSIVFGEKYKKNKNICIHAERSFQVVPEETALRILFSFVHDLSTNGCSLVLFNSYLSLPPLLSALDRHDLTKSFYTTFTALLQVVDLVKKQIYHFPSIEDIQEKESNSDLSTIIELCTSHKEKLSNFAKPMTVVKFCKEKPQAFQVRTIRSSFEVAAYSKKPLACQIHFGCIPPLRLVGFCLIPVFNISSDMNVQFEQHPVLLEHVTIIFENCSNLETEVKFTNGVIGILQLPPDRIGIPRSIPHLQVQGGIFSSTAGIVLGLERKPTDKQDDIVSSISRDRLNLNEKLGNSIEGVFQEEVNRIHNAQSTGPDETLNDDNRQTVTKDFPRNKELSLYKLEQIPLTIPQKISSASSFAPQAQETTPLMIQQQALLTTLEKVPQTQKRLAPRLQASVVLPQPDTVSRAPVPAVRIENSSVFKFDGTKYDDVILATFEYHGGWFMQVLFRSLVLGKPELRLGVRPNLILCETCQSNTALHSTMQCPALESCSCPYKPPHTRRSCKNPICWICKEAHPWRSCPNPILDGLMKLKSKKGYRFLNDMVLYQSSTDVSPLLCETKSKVLHILGQHWSGSRNILVGRNIHTLLKLFVSKETDNTHLISGAVDLAWLLTDQQKDTDPAILLHIPHEVFHDLHLRSVRLENLFSPKGVDLTEHIAPVNSIEDIHRIKTRSKNVKNSKQSSNLEINSSNEMNIQSPLDKQKNSNYKIMSSNLNIELNSTEQAENRMELNPTEKAENLTEYPDPSSPPYIVSSSSEDEDIVVLTTSKSAYVPSENRIHPLEKSVFSSVNRGSSPDIIIYPQKEWFSFPDKTDELENIQVSAEPEYSESSPKYKVNNDSDIEIQSNEFDSSRFRCLMLYPNFENFVRAYFEMKNGDICSERCDNIICHLASAMELDSINPLLNMIRDNYDETRGLKDWALIFQDDYQMFSDDFIPTELVVNILLWIYTTQSPGETGASSPGSTAQPTSNTKSVREPDSNYKFESEKRSEIFSRSDFEIRIESDSRSISGVRTVSDLRTKSRKSREIRDLRSKIGKRTEYPTSSNSESRRNEPNHYRSESGRSAGKNLENDNIRSSGADSRYALISSTSGPSSSSRPVSRRRSGLPKSNPVIEDCLIDEEIICLD